MLILASRSPRRRQLLGLLGLEFDVRPAAIPETALPGERPDRVAVRLAREKALAVALSLSARERSRAVVLGADTVVALDGDIFGKPRSAAEARRMIARLSGRTHRVMTGIAVWSGASGRMRTGHRTTRVTFATLGKERIRRYVRSGEPMDVAGAYAIQGLAGAFIPRVAGSVSNVVGLPLDLAAEMLARAGVRGLV